MIPQEIIDRIKRDTNLVEYVQSRGVKLTKSGKEYRGLCPFHDDKTPSFFVSPVMNLWNCFVCDIGGDVLKFVQAFDKVSFEEAVELLCAGQWGVEGRRQESEVRIQKGEFRRGKWSQAGFSGRVASASLRVLPQDLQ
jgi:DNA primase